MTRVLVRHPAHRGRPTSATCSGALARLGGRPAPGRQLLLRGRPARPHLAAGPGRAADPHPRAGRHPAGRGPRPRGLHPVRAEPRAPARRAGLADGVHRQLRRAAADDAVQGQVGARTSSCRPGCSPTRRSWPPTSCCTTPTGCRSATTSASTWSSPGTWPCASTPATATPSSCPRAPSPPPAPGSWTCSTPPRRCPSRSTPIRARSLLADSLAVIEKKLKRAVTDTETEVRFDPAAKPGVSNLLSILGAATGRTPEQAAEGYTQYGPLKADTAAAVVAVVGPIQDRYRELVADPAETARLLGHRCGQGLRGRRRHPRPGPRRHRAAPVGPLTDGGRVGGLPA